MFYKKEDYDRCLPLILAVRKYAKFLNVIFYIEDMHVKKLPLFEHPATDDFLKVFPNFLWSTTHFVDCKGQFCVRLGHPWGELVR